MLKYWDRFAVGQPGWKKQACSVLITKLDFKNPVSNVVVEVKIGIWIDNVCFIEECSGEDFSLTGPISDAWCFSLNVSSWWNEQTLARWADSDSLVYLSGQPAPDLAVACLHGNMKKSCYGGIVIYFQSEMIPANRTPCASPSYEIFQGVGGAETWGKERDREEPFPLVP